MRMLRQVISDSPTAVDASTAPLLVPPTSAAAGRSLAPPAGGNTDSYHANVVIYLATLLCIFICVLSLNSLIRCALHYYYYGRRTHAVAAPPAATVAAPATDAGLKKRALRRIPVAVYEARAGAPAAECAICLGEFVGGEKVRLLPRCHHGFHVRCIDMWFLAHSSCPICRNSLLDEGGAGEATTVAREGTT